jgi:hypothetical protein
MLACVTELACVVGYARSPSFLRAVVDAVADVRAANPDVVFGEAS